MRHVVVLIHGTWGRKSSWLQKGSALRESVLKALGCPTCRVTGGECCVLFDPFLWSGANSIRKRLSAARALREKLIDLRKEFPNAKIHAIAHSHGGNVAMYAVRERGPLVDSLTCLSTPFLLAIPRTLGTGAGRLLRSAMSLLTIGALTGLIASGVWAVRSVPRLRAALNPWMAAVLDWLDPVFASHPERVLGGIAAGALLLLLILEFVWITIHERAQQLAGRMRLPEKLLFPVLIVRGGGDEAHASLDAAQLGSTLITKFLQTALRLFGSREGTLRIGRRSVRWAVTGGVALLIASPLAATIPAVQAYVSAKMFYGFLLLPVAFSAVALLCIAILLPVLALFMASFGGAMTAAVSLYISTESTPPGEWKLTQLTPLPISPDTRLTLRHFTHTDDRALNKLEQWLSRHVDRLPVVREPAIA